MTKKGAKKKISFHEFSDEELAKLYTENKKELRELRFNLVTSVVPNVRRFRAAKRDIARILTVQRERAKKAQVAQVEVSS